MDEIDLHQLPPNNVLQNFTIFATIGSAALSLSPSWLTHIQIPRGNLSITTIIIVIGIISYWIIGYAPVFASNGLRKLLGINHEFSIQRTNFVQFIITIVSAIIIFFYSLGFIVGVSTFNEFTIETIRLVVTSWFLWWTAGETSFLLRKIVSKSRLTYRAMIFLFCIISACGYGVFFLLTNPFHLFFPSYEFNNDYSTENVLTMLRCNIPFVPKC